MDFLEIAYFWASKLFYLPVFISNFHVIIISAKKPLHLYKVKRRLKFFFFVKSVRHSYFSETVISWNFKISIFSWNNNLLLKTYWKLDNIKRKQFLKFIQYHLECGIGIAIVWVFPNPWIRYSGRIKKKIFVKYTVW